MRRLAIFLPLLLAPAFAADDGKPPDWAYPVNPPDFKLAPDDGTPRRVPDSSASYTLTQIRDLFFAPDWHPEDHPPMPDIVARGRKPDVMACASCHRTDGSGGPENASLAGLPAAYIVQQVRDMKSGARGTALPEGDPDGLLDGHYRLPLELGELHPVWGIVDGLVREAMRKTRAAERKRPADGSHE